MKNILLGLYLPLDSPLHRLDIRVKLPGFFLLLSGLLISKNPWGYLLSLALTLSLAFISRLPSSVIISPLRRLWPFLLIVLLINSLFLKEGEALFSLGIFSFYSQGFSQGLRIILNLLLIMALSSILTATSSPREITQGLSSLLSPLALLGLPVDELAMILSIALQFIPSLLQETRTIKKAQRARGADLSSKNLRRRLDSFFALVIPIFISAFRRADDLAQAMEARGYRGARGRTKREPSALSSMDYIGLLAAIIAFTLHLYLRKI